MFGSAKPHVITEDNLAGIELVKPTVVLEFEFVNLFTALITEDLHFPPFFLASRQFSRRLCFS